MEQKTRLGLKYFAATVVVASAIGALVWKRAPPQIDKPPAPKCDAPAVCESPPVKGDLKCEIDKGEAEPLSKNFDPESCGYCGDGIRQVQVKAAKGSEPYADEDGNPTQKVTERPSETMDDCPVDFNCGIGNVDPKSTYGSLIAPKNAGGAWEVGTVTLTKSCNPKAEDYCASDCAKWAKNRRFTKKDVIPGLPETEDIIANCRSEIVSPEYSGKARALEWNIRTTLDKKAPDIRKGLGTSDSADVLVTFFLVVSPTGSLSLNNASFTCDGIRCPNTVDAQSVFGLNFSSESIDPPRATCNWTITKRIHKLGNSDK